MRFHRSLLIAVSVACLIGAACGGNGPGSGSTTGGPSGSGSGSANGLPQPPTATIAPATSIGAGEGQLNMIVWEGYAEPQWVKPFETQSGCKVNAKYDGTSGDMVNDMKDGGGGQYDVVSASGDASLRLIYDGDVMPVNVSLLPDFPNLMPQLQSPPGNTVNGVHYGISTQWGPNVLLYDKATFATQPTSWSVIYDPTYSGKITVPDNPIQIADAALYLSKTKPDLGITDPYELNQAQFQAAIDLLKQQRPLVKKYWGLASQEISLFKNGDAVVGAAWPYQTSTLVAAGANVADTIPTQGATGWVDTYMLATKAPHPNCAYLWMKWITSPQVQAQQAVSYGETPANTKACTYMDAIQAGACAQYHANAPASYFDSISFWKTPQANCGNGKTDCVPFPEWNNAWTTEVTG